jgi:hypothetical protein
MLSLTVECEQNVLILYTNKTKIISESCSRKRLNFPSKSQDTLRAEVNKVNRKILLTVFVLTAVLLATPYVGMVHATGKGTTKQYYEFYLKGSFGPGPDTKVWTTKDNIEQIRNLVFSASYIEVTVGATTYIPDPASYSALMDFTLDLNTMTLYARIHESFAIAGGTIDQRTAELVTDYGTLFNGGGDFVGFGSGALEGVKIQGTTGFDFTNGLALDRVGTVMGWP